MRTYYVKYGYTLGGSFRRYYLALSETELLENADLVLKIFLSVITNSIQPQAARDHLEISIVKPDMSYGLVFLDEFDPLPILFPVGWTNIFLEIDYLRADGWCVDDEICVPILEILDLFPGFLSELTSKGVATQENIYHKASETHLLCRICREHVEEDAIGEESEGLLFG